HTRSKRDWSSDVCSSDLCPRTAAPAAATTAGGEEQRLAGMLIDAASGVVDWNSYQDTTAQELRALVQAKLDGREAQADGPARARSEERRVGKECRSRGEA